MVTLAAFLAGDGVLGFSFQQADRASTLLARSDLVVAQAV